MTDDVTRSRAVIAGRRLLAARKGAAAPGWRDIVPASRDEAYAVQDATVALLGTIGGWKVGAKGPQAEPTFAPLPAAGLFASGIELVGPPWAMRGIEVEVALRLSRDIDAHDGMPDAATLAAAVDAVLPVIEVVETRLVDWRDSDPLAQLADLQSHGALVLGVDATTPARNVDLRNVDASLVFNGEPIVDTHGGNPAADVWRLLGLLAMHCTRRGMPLRRGQIVTTGSCTGMRFAPQGARVRGEVGGIGAVEVRF